jgi:hypothetical protein
MTGATAAIRFGDDGGDEPALIGVVHGPVAIEMARDALAEEAIPVYIKQNSLGSIYGLSIGGFGSAEVWAPRPAEERARDILIGIGLLAPADDSTTGD